MKNRIRLNESQLHRVIKESVKRVLKENETNEMAISRIRSGAFKDGVKMNKEDYAIITKVYHDLIKAMESNDASWNDNPLGDVLRKIWTGPVQDLGTLLRNNSCLGEWENINHGNKHGW